MVDPTLTVTENPVGPRPEELEAASGEHEDTAAVVVYQMPKEPCNQL